MSELRVEQPDRRPGAGKHEKVARWRPVWARVRKSPFLPATVLVFILAIAAGLFAGSYTYSMANPTPHRIPVALIGSGDAGKGFLAGLDTALNGSLHVDRYADRQSALDAVEAQRVFGIVDVTRPDRIGFDVSGASGSTVAQALTESATAVGRTMGSPVVVSDIKPLQKGDPRGLTLFYITLAAVIIGMVGAIQLSVHARALNPAEGIAFIAASALTGSFVIAAVVDWWLGALRLPFVHSWLILALTMFTTGMIFTMFNTLFGRWAMIPTWALLVLLGNPSSGGAVSWPLLPSPLGIIGRWLPPGASVNAQHTAVYFAGHQHVFPYLVLAAWALVACVVFWVWRGRHPGGRYKDDDIIGS